MKKMTYALLTAIVCFGCGETANEAITAAPTPVKAQHARNNAPYFTYGNPVLLQYDQYLAGLDTQLVDMGKQAIDTFQVLFKKEPAAVCDTAQYLFHQFQKSVASYLDSRVDVDSIFVDEFYAWEDGEGNKHEISKRAKGLIKKWETNGIYYAPEEGAMYFEPDWQYQAKSFGVYVSAATKEYLTQMAKDQKEGFQNDAAITIAPVTLADRTVWWEKFAKANPSFIYANDAFYQHRIAMYALMEGMDNTSVRMFFSDTLANDSLSSYFSTAWQYVQDKYPTSVTNGYVTPLFTAWQKRDTAAISKTLAKFDKEYVQAYP